jgi:hypothetical protein
VLSGVQDASTKRKIQRESAKQLRVIQKIVRESFHSHITPHSLKEPKKGKRGISHDG